MTTLAVALEQRLNVLMKGGSSYHPAIHRDQGNDTYGSHIPNQYRIACRYHKVFSRALRPVLLLKRRSHASRVEVNDFLYAYTLSYWLGQPGGLGFFGGMRFSRKNDKPAVSPILDSQ